MVAVLHENKKWWPKWPFGANESGVLKVFSQHADCQNQNVHVNSEMSASHSSIQGALLCVHHPQCALRFKKKVETDDTWNKKRTLASIRAQSHSLKVVEQSAWMRKCSQCVKNEQNSISKHLELRRYSHSSTPGPSRLWWVDENRTFSVFRTL